MKSTVQCSYPHCQIVDGLMKCGDCNIASYCSRNCQFRHWPMHQKTCLLKQHEARRNNNTSTQQLQQTQIKKHIQHHSLQRSHPHYHQQYQRPYQQPYQQQVQPYYQHWNMQQQQNFVSNTSSLVQQWLQSIPLKTNNGIQLPDNHTQSVGRTSNLNKGVNSKTTANTKKDPNNRRASNQTPLKRKTNTENESVQKKSRLETIDIAVNNMRKGKEGETKVVSRQSFEETERVEDTFDLSPKLQAEEVKESLNMNDTQNEQRSAEKESLTLSQLKAVHIHKNESHVHYNLTSSNGIGKAMPCKATNSVFLPQKQQPQQNSDNSKKARNNSCTSNQSPLKRKTNAESESTNKKSRLETNETTSLNDICETTNHTSSDILNITRSTFSDIDLAKYGKYFSYIGEFILKDFIDEETNESSNFRGQIENIYMGQASANSKKKELLFHVQYHDGDTEDLTLDEVHECKNDYKTRGDCTQNNDSVGNETVENEDSRDVEVDQDLFQAIQTATKVAVDKRKSLSKMSKEPITAHPKSETWEDDDEDEVDNENNNEGNIVAVQNVCRVTTRKRARAELKNDTRSSKRNESTTSYSSSFHTVDDLHNEYLSLQKVNETLSQTLNEAELQLYDKAKEIKAKEKALRIAKNEIRKIEDQLKAKDIELENIANGTKVISLEHSLYALKKRTEKGTEAMEAVYKKAEDVSKYVIKKKNEEIEKKDKDIISKESTIKSQKEEIKRLQQELSKAKASSSKYVTKAIPNALLSELECPICLDPFKDPCIVPECCHRFCTSCIENSIKECGKECPLCRKRVTSKRALRKDGFIERITNILFDKNEGKEGQENS